MMTEKLGRFGHHPDPAIDFCTEVDVIGGMYADWRAGLLPLVDVGARASRAVTFNVGGDAHAIAAKDKLRDLIAA